MKRCLLILFLLHWCIDATAQNCFSLRPNYHINFAETIDNADFNNDGFLDLVMCKFAYPYLQIHEGTGTDSFIIATYAIMPHNIVNNVIVSDFNNDNNADIVIAGACVEVLLGDGAFNFHDTVYDPNGREEGIGVGDFNGDNFEDIVARKSSDPKYIFIFLNNGNGVFNAPDSFPIDSAWNSYPPEIATGDFNRDGFDDFALENSTGFRIYFGDSSGSIVSGPAYNNFINSNNYIVTFSIADLNNDSFPDLITRSDSMYIYLNDGTGNLLRSQSFYGGGFRIITADIDNDGFRDIVYTHSSNYITVLYNNSSGLFFQSLQFPTTNWSRELTSGDFNNDGRIDIATAHADSFPRMNLLLNSDAITGLTINSTIPSCNKYSDGSLSLVPSGSSNQFQYLWTMPNGSTDTNSVIMNLRAGQYNFLVTDTSGCGYRGYTILTEPLPIHNSAVNTNVNCAGSANIDLTTNTTGGTSPYFYLWNTSSLDTTSYLLNITSGQYILNTQDSHGCMIEDTFNVDGSVQVGISTLHPTIITKPKYIVTSDINGDSLSDIITINDSLQLSVMLNNGGGLFSFPILFNVALNSIGAKGLQAAEFNHDGKKDIIVAGMNKFWVLPGDGLGSFGNAITTNIRQGDKITDFTIGIFNNDQFPDLAYIDKDREIMGILLGNGNGTFTAGPYEYFNEPLFKIKYIGSLDDLLISTNNDYVFLYHDIHNTSPWLYYQQDYIGCGNSFFLNGYINGDANEDIICGSNDATVSFTNSVGQFYNIRSSHLPAFFDAASGADINADNSQLDIIGIDSNSIYITPSNGTGYYPVASGINLGTKISDVTTSDFDRDGNNEIAITLEDSNQVMIFYNCLINSITKIDPANDLVLFPNPANQTIFIKQNFSERLQVSIRSVDGKIVKELQNVVSEFNISDLTSGIYFVELTSRDHSYTSKLIVSHQ